MRRGAVILTLAALVPGVSTAAPAAPTASSAPPVAELVAAGAHTCERSPAGDVRCWGSNYLGQLGDGTTTDRPASAPVSSAGGLRPGQAVAISAGLTHTCAVTRDGALYCWGYNGSGRLGDGGQAMFRATPSRAAPMLGPIRAVSAGARHTCAVTREGRLFCWGDNSQGQLGDGTRTGGGPRAVLLREHVLSVSAGGNHTCALTRSRRLYCFGDGSFGQLGDDQQAGSPVPRLVHRGQGLEQGRVVAMDAGSTHTCAAVDDGRVLCWGSNMFGQLGDGTLQDRRVPVRVADPALTTLRADSVSTGARHTCLADRGGTAFCWGDNTFGQLGTGVAGVSPMPGRVVGPHMGTPFRSVVAGQEHTCGVNRSAVTLCWGSNVSGRSGAPPAVAIVPVASLAGWPLAKSFGP